MRGEAQLGALGFEVGDTRVSVLGPIDLVVDLTGVNGCLHALDRAHTQDDFREGFQNGSLNGSLNDPQNGSQNDSLDCLQAMSLAVISIQSISPAKDHRSAASPLL